MKKITAFILAAMLAMVATSFVACKIECAGCGGTGICQGEDCYGLGKVKDKNGNVIDCPVCNGSGKCRACDGDQKIKRKDNTTENSKKATMTDEQIKDEKKNKGF